MADNKLQDAITLQVRGNTAIITLNVPKKLNALTLEHYYRLATLMQQVAAMDDVVITVLTGKGRFFSGGADVTASRSFGTNPSENHRAALYSFVPNNLNITRAFYTHPKLLVAALNGPAVGLSAALVAHADFVYAAPHTYLLLPFTSLGLVAEGGTSRALVRRLGEAKTAEALYMSRRITCEELVRTGFVNKVFEGLKPDESERFLELVLAETRERLGDHLSSGSLLRMKKLLRSADIEALEKAGVDEVMEGLQRFAKGIPQEEFRKMASGEKKHKL